MQLYRRTLALPGVRPLMILIFFARIPMSAAGMVLTLHVAVGLSRGYGAAGTVGAVATIAIALGAPIMGRVVDRYGLRPMLIITTLGEVTFWLTARLMPYPLLLVIGFLGGFLQLPAMSIGRQALAALVPLELRRTAYSVDSISTEASYMVGPAAAVFFATQFSTTTAMTAMACGIGAVGLALFIVNPAVRSAEELANRDGERPPRHTWLTSRLIGVLVVGVGAVFVLAGTEVTVVAVLRAHGEVEWVGLVVVLWAAVSAVGGLIYGALHRTANQVTLMALLGGLTIPVGLAGGHWWVVALALVPAAALCAPTIAATAEQVSKLAPAAVRGEAMGLQSSAFTTGAAFGAPLTGFVMDHTAPGWGFVVAGLGGVLIAATAAVLILRRQAPVPDYATSASAIS
jgi:MFS family permease